LGLVFFLVSPISAVCNGDPDGFVAISPEAEVCDDGNDTETDDGCTDCLVDEYWECTDSTVNPSVCTPICGDEFVFYPLEECDDGDGFGGDGCAADCTIEDGYTCSGEPSLCGTCGDGILQGEEECDNPEDDTCSSDCTIEVSLSLCDEDDTSALCEYIADDFHQDVTTSVRALKCVNTFVILSYQGNDLSSFTMVTRIDSTGTDACYDAVCSEAIKNAPDDGLKCSHNGSKKRAIDQVSLFIALAVPRPPPEPGSEPSYYPDSSDPSSSGFTIIVGLSSVVVVLLTYFF